MHKYLILFLLFGIGPCVSNKNTSNRAFYYWKTYYDLHPEEKKLTEDLEVNKFYIRFFDVDWSETRKEAIPVGTLDFSYTSAYVDVYVPCIFINNTVMMKSTKSQLDTLASRIKKKSADILTSLHYLKSKNYERPNDTILWKIPEFQIDCDWTEGSKENYFYFLKKVKDLLPGTKLSVTLRLWQLKYQKKAGIPPVDRAMLMCYSTGNPREYQIENSLASYKDIEPYLKGERYNLPLDIALPVYNWAVLFRNKKFKGILRDIDASKVTEDTLRYTHIHGNRYYFKSDTVAGNTYIRYGDEIRLENMPADDMERLIKLLKKENLVNAESTIAFFSWDTTYIQNYGKENLQSYYNSFN